MSTTVITCIALMGILLFLLGANVTRHRAVRGATGNQMPTDPADRMFIAQRAHGNASEYVPTLIGLLVVCSALTDGWWLDTLARNPGQRYVSAGRRGTVTFPRPLAARLHPRFARHARPYDT